MSTGIHTPKGTYRKANIALGLSAVGLVTAYPFQNAFIGGLITSACSAALVGGLADWFAVNALFRRPLGVRPGKVFRTEIIPRNRERIYQALSDMVQNELLSEEALRMKLTHYDFSAPLLKIWEAEGVKSFEGPLAELLQRVLSSLPSDIHSLEKEGESLLINEKFQHETLYPLVGQALQTVAESNDGKRAIETLTKTLRVWAQSPEAHNWLVHWLENAIARYVNENPSRKFLTMFLPDPTMLATKLQQQMLSTLLGDEATEKIQAWLTEQGKKFSQASEYNQSELMVKMMHSGIRKLLRSLNEALQKLLPQNPKTTEDSLRISQSLLRAADTWMVNLKESPEEREKFNTRVQTMLFPLVASQHGRIGKIVQEGLERYTDERLVELIEAKTGEDLQMIRINGSVVGGLAGMLIFIVNWLI